MQLIANSLGNLIKHDPKVAIDRERVEVDYNPTDIATDTEIVEAGNCNCIIHSGGRKIMKVDGYTSGIKFLDQGGDK